MAQTAHLGITLLEAAQAQKEVTANEAFVRIDALLNGGTAQPPLAAPPASPVDGDVYLVGASASGAWVGKDGQIAYFDQLWRFIAPRDGSTIWVNSAQQFYVYDSVGGWEAASVHPQAASARTMMLPASMFAPQLTGGCAPLAQLSLGSGKPEVRTLNFDANVDEFAQCILTLPANWDEGSLSAEFLWSHASVSGAFGVVWSLEALMAGNTEALGQSFGSNTNQLDTGGTADTLYVSPVSGAVTPAGSIAAENALLLRVSRVATHANDTLAVDARLHAVRLLYSTVGI